MLVTSCSHDDHPTELQQYVDVPLVIFDTDIGSSTDDLFALEMLYRYEEEGRCKLLGVVVNREGEDYAACADVMNTYFGHGDVPIGWVRNGVKAPRVFIDYRLLYTYTDGDGQPMFQRSLTDYASLPDGWQLYRQLLAAQPDHSVSLVSVGFVTCLAQLLESAPDSYSPLSGVELVRRKVKCLYLMGGVFRDAVESIEYNFSQSLGSAQTLFRLWPAEVDIMMSPGEVGDGVEYRPETVIADIDWTDVHPIKQVYMTRNCNTGQKMWDLLPVIQAVEGDELFSLSERGNVMVNDNAETSFIPSPTGYCRYQMPGSSEWNAKILEKIRNVNRQHAHP